MGNVESILNMLRTTFKPEAQELALKVMKDNRQLLKSEKYAFTELPRAIAGRKEAEALEQGLVRFESLEVVPKVELIKEQRRLAMRLTENEVQELSKISQKATDFRNKERILTVTENFETKKQNLISLLESRNAVSELKKVKAAQNPEEFAQAVSEILTDISNSMSSTNTHFIKKLPKRQKKNLLQNFEFMQISCHNSMEICEFDLAVQKAILTPSKDKKVLEIENFIKEKYGIEYIHLDNITNAEEVLKVLEIAQKK